MLPPLSEVVRVLGLTAVAVGVVWFALLPPPRWARPTPVASSLTDPPPEEDTVSATPPEPSYAPVADASQDDGLIEQTDFADTDEGLPQPSQDPSAVIDSDAGVDTGRDL